VRVVGVGAQSIQGDVAFADVVQAMGAQVSREESAIEVSGINVAKAKNSRRSIRISI